MSKGVFITGTDTGVGKTLVAAALLHAWAQRGKRVLGMKPVASGAEQQGGELRNADAVLLWALSNVPARYDEVNPYVYAPQVAPHIAAAATSREIDVDRIRNTFRELSDRCERIVVEGVGGWYVPLSQTRTMADVARDMALPVVMVVSIRLGCLNHALLTQQAIESSGLKLAGWVANGADPAMERAAENIAGLIDRISAPLLAKLPYQAEPRADASAALLDLARLEERL